MQYASSFQSSNLIIPQTQTIKHAIVHNKLVFVLCSNLTLIFKVTVTYKCMIKILHDVNWIKI